MGRLLMHAFQDAALARVGELRNMPVPSDPPVKVAANCSSSTAIRRRKRAPEGRPRASKRTPPPRSDAAKQDILPFWRQQPRTTVSTKTETSGSTCHRPLGTFHQLSRRLSFKRVIRSAAFLAALISAAPVARAHDQLSPLQRAILAAPPAPPAAAKPKPSTTSAAR